VKLSAKKKLSNLRSAVNASATIEIAQGMIGSLTAAEDHAVMSLAKPHRNPIRRWRLTTDPLGVAIAPTTSLLAPPVVPMVAVVEVEVEAVEVDEVVGPPRRSGSRIRMDSKLRRRNRSPLPLADHGLLWLLNLPLMTLRALRTLMTLLMVSSKSR